MTVTITLTDFEKDMMKGYVLKALRTWNDCNPEDAVPDKMIDNLLDEMHWALEDMSADEAHRYYREQTDHA